MRKKFAGAMGSVTLGLLFFAGSLPAVAAPAEPAGAAADDIWGCPSSYACFWAGAHMAPPMGKVSENNKNFGNLPYSSGCTSGSWNDCISAVDNNGTTCTVYWFMDADYKGRWHSLHKGDYVTDLSSSSPPPIGYADPSFNDAISSNRWCQ
jgi:hypothetical protein